MPTSAYDDEAFLRRYVERALTHRYLPFPHIIQLLGDISVCSVLDLGCGSGDLCEMMHDQGARVTGADVSHEWIALCRERYAARLGDRLQFVRENGAQMSFAAGCFDAVVLNLVLLNVETLPEVSAFFTEAARVLGGGGRLIFSDLHPLCLMGLKSPNRFFRYEEGFSYSVDGAQYVAGLELASGETIEFRNRHWTIPTLVRLAHEAGFRITGIAEPRYGDDAPAELKAYTYPEFMLFLCEKAAAVGRS